MGRGRAGLYCIPPEKIKAAIGISAQWLVAEGFHVSTRTVRRWCRVGMAPGYAGTNPTREQWEVFAATNQRDRFRWRAHSISVGKAPEEMDFLKPAKKAKAARRK